MSWREFKEHLFAADHVMGPSATQVRWPAQQVLQITAPAVVPAARSAVPQPQPSALQPALPYQVPASWGQGTAVMPMAPPTTAVPMSVDRVEECGGVFRVRDGRCSTCLDSVLAGTPHPDPCTKPVICLQSGHLQHDCPAAAAVLPAVPASQQAPPRQSFKPARGAKQDGSKPNRTHHEQPPQDPVPPQPTRAEPHLVNLLGQRFTSGGEQVNVLKPQTSNNRADRRALQYPPPHAQRNCPGNYQLYINRSYFRPNQEREGRER